jgi:putative ABC transport system permease protein
MLYNYLKIALRNLRRHKVYSFINIFSLAIGIAICTLIFLYVRDEFTHDRFHAHADRIYRLYRVEQRTNGTTKVSAGLPTPLAPALLNEVPGVEQVVRLWKGESLVRRGERVFQEEVVYADPAFFEVFTFPLAAAGTSGRARRWSVQRRPRNISGPRTRWVRPC